MKLLERLLLFLSNNAVTFKTFTADLHYTINTLRLTIQLRHIHFDKLTYVIYKVCRHLRLAHLFLLIILKILNLNSTLSLFELLFMQMKLHAFLLCPLDSVNWHSFA